MALKRLNAPDDILNRVQDNVDSALIPLQNAPLSGGALLSSISLTSGQDNLIQHTLGRIPKIAIPGIPNVSTNIWSPASASLGNQSSNSQYINIRCSTTCVVSVWVN